MRSKGTLILAALLSPCVAQGSRPELPVLRLYLPRTAVTEKDRLTLGDVAVIHSDDAALSAKASAVALGRAPWPAEKLALTRTTILSRLASHRIFRHRVRFSGAAKVTVERKTKVISAEQIARLADEFVKKHPPTADDGSVLERAGAVRELVLPVTAKVELKVRPAPASPPGHVVVEVVAQRGEKALASARVLFQRVYLHKVAVAVKQIEPGEAITPTNARIETVKSARPQRDWQNPYGLVATQRLDPGARIQPTSLQDAKPRAPTKLKRNTRVIIRLRGPGFVILARGVLLADGKIGDTVQVRNVDTQAELTGKIMPDGSVEIPLR